MPVNMFSPRLTLGGEYKEVALTVPSRNIFLKICMRSKQCGCTRDARDLKESFGL